ncbi:hypothetical protein BKA66DRAFT_441662 [Pyrenochaeta sp. MPI-SDFR-AT-0127]|nr:hypothetical protein BKA66DRAFT_441662 [Pyrenochaeta sp. MPI-SDFR-AT-0127]
MAGLVQIRRERDDVRAVGFGRCLAISWGSPATHWGLSVGFGRHGADGHEAKARAEGNPLTVSRSECAAQRRAGYVQRRAASSEPEREREREREREPSWADVSLLASASLPSRARASASASAVIPVAASRPLCHVSKRAAAGWPRRCSMLERSRMRPSRL